MPGFIGLTLCPDLVMVEPNFDKYTAVSQQIRQIFDAYDPNFCPMSLDEAYLDFTHHLEKRRSSAASERTFLLRASNSNSPQVCGCDLNSTLRQQLLKLLGSLQLQDGDLNNLSRVQLKDLLPNVPPILSNCTECSMEIPEFVLRVYGLSTEDAVMEMRNRIEQRTRLTASAGQ